MPMPCGRGKYALCVCYLKFLVEIDHDQGDELVCNEHGTIYVISSDFSDRMITQSMELMVLLSKHF